VVVGGKSLCNNNYFNSLNRSAEVRTALVPFRRGLSFWQENLTNISMPTGV
jgi:hypothetical protein